MSEKKINTVHGLARGPAGGASEDRSRALLAELVSGLHDLPPELERRLPIVTVEYLRFTSERLRADFPQLERHLELVTSQDDRLGFSYRVEARTAAGLGLRWQGHGVARLVDRRFEELELHEDPWAWQLQLGIVPVSGPYSATGTWASDLFGLPFELRLEQRPASSEVIGLMESMARRVVVHGENRGSELRVWGPPEAELVFTCRWREEDCLEGRLDPFEATITARRISWRGPSLWPLR